MKDTQAIHLFAKEVKWSDCYAIKNAYKNVVFYRCDNSEIPLPEKSDERVDDIVIEIRLDSYFDTNKLVFPNFGRDFCNSVYKISGDAVNGLRLCICYGMQNLREFSVKNMHPITGNKMFANCTSLRKVTGLETAGASLDSAAFMFSGCIHLEEVPDVINVSEATDTSYMFHQCFSLKRVPKQLETSNVTNMECMFAGCRLVETIPMMDTSKVENMFDMFNLCISIETIPQFDTGNVITMNGMFRNCISLKKVPELNLESLRDASRMFMGCKSLEEKFPVKSLSPKTKFVTNEWLFGLGKKPKPLKEDTLVMIDTFEGTPFSG